MPIDNSHSTPDALSLPAAFLDDVLEEYHRDGEVAIERLWLKDPRAYLMLTACLLPQYAEEIQRALDGARVRELQ